MVDKSRAQRIGDLMRKELGRLFLHEIKDPRIKHLSITEVQVSRDLSFAKVYFTIAEKDKDVKAAKTALEKASGFMRSRIAEELELRKTPKLNFIYDDAMEYGRKMTALLDSLDIKDEESDKE